MNLLAPYIRRFRSFVIDVHTSSSVPSVTTYFNNGSIDSLEYVCNLDHSEDTVSNEPYDYGFLIPGSITSMILDGVGLWFLEGLTRSIFLNPDRDVGNPAPLELHLICGSNKNCRTLPV